MIIFCFLGVGPPCCSILCQFWLCEEAQCVYLRCHLGSLCPYYSSSYRLCFFYFIYLFIYLFIYIQLQFFIFLIKEGVEVFLRKPILLPESKVNEEFVICSDQNLDS